MAELANFHTIKRSIVTVTDDNDGTTWELADDVPMAIIAQFLAIQNQVSNWQTSTESQDIIDGLAESERAINEVCVAIFQHTYPDFTENDLVQHFSYEDRMLLGKLFFLRRSSRLSALSNEPTVSPTATTTQRPASTPLRTRSSRK